MAIKIEWINKLIYSYDRILINSKKKWTMAAHNKMDESQKYVEWKLSDTEESVLCDAIYMMLKNR